MSDFGESIANVAVANVVKRLKKLYEQAQRDLRAKLAAFNARHAREDAKKRKQLADGLITMAQYRSWMKGQVFQKGQWEDKVKQIADMISHVNEDALEIIQKERNGVFAESHNYEAYQTEKDVKGVVSFDIYNKDTVGRIIRENPQLLPKWKIDKPKDYKWNQQKIENTIVQGIIQGESIDQITERLVKELCTQNETKMRMFARTAMTSAQNAGKQQQMEEAEEKGVQLQKQWVATLDNRTRDAHQALDGQVVDVDKAFSGGGEAIRFPGDPNCSPAMTYNCRCSMRRVFKGIKTKRQRRAYEDDDGSGRRRSYIVEDMTYKEWVEWKKVHKP